MARQGFLATHTNNIDTSTHTNIVSHIENNLGCAAKARKEAAAEGGCGQKGQKGEGGRRERRRYVTATVGACIPRNSQPHTRRHSDSPSTASHASYTYTHSLTDT